MPSRQSDVTAENIVILASINLNGYIGMPCMPPNLFKANIQQPIVTT